MLVGVAVGVLVGVGVGVAVFVGVAVEVKVEVAVGVGVGLAVGVEVGVGVAKAIVHPRGTTGIPAPSVSVTNETCRSMLAMAPAPPMARKLTLATLETPVGEVRLEELNADRSVSPESKLCGSANGWEENSRVSPPATELITTSAAS